MAKEYSATLLQSPPGRTIKPAPAAAAPEGVAAAPPRSHVRRHPRLRPFLIVDQQVPRHVHVLALAIVFPQPVRGVRQRMNW